MADDGYLQVIRTVLDKIGNPFTPAALMQFGQGFIVSRSTGVGPKKVLIDLDSAAVAVPAAIDVLVNNDSGSPTVTYGSGVTVANGGMGITVVTFFVPFLVPYKANVCAEDLASGALGPIDAWILGRSLSAITIGTAQSTLGSTILADGVGFNLSIRA